MKICYVPWKPTGATIPLLNEVNKIVDHYLSNRLALTLRQLYYRLVATGILEENNIRQYKKLQRIVNDARLGGLLDWDAIEDRGRHVHSHSSWTDPQAILQSAADSFKLPLWDDQPKHLEVWVEKDALLGVMQRACERWRVSYTSSRGNTSQSEAYVAARRFKRYARDGKQCVILHMADHDPTGVDMTRDLQDRFRMFDAPVTVQRLALTYEQVLERNPPPQFAKETDSRTAGYVAQFGDECWELDAIEPLEMVELVADAIKGHIDLDLWSEGLKRERDEAAPLYKIAANHEAVFDFVNNLNQDEEE